MQTKHHHPVSVFAFNEGSVFAADTNLITQCLKHLQLQLLLSHQKFALVCLESNKGETLKSCLRPPRGCSIRYAPQYETIGALPAVEM